MIPYCDCQDINKKHFQMYNLKLQNKSNNQSSTGKNETSTNVINDNKISNNLKKWNLFIPKTSDKDYDLNYNFKKNTNKANQNIDFFRNLNFADKKITIQNQKSRTKENFYKKDQNKLYYSINAKNENIKKSEENNNIILRIDPKEIYEVTNYKPTTASIQFKNRFHSNKKMINLHDGNVLLFLERVLNNRNSKEMKLNPPQRLNVTTSNFYNKNKIKIFSPKKSNDSLNILYNRTEADLEINNENVKNENQKYQINEVKNIAINDPCKISENLNPNENTIKQKRHDLKNINNFDIGVTNAKRDGIHQTKRKFYFDKKIVIDSENHEKGKNYGNNNVIESHSINKTESNNENIDKTNSMTATKHLKKIEKYNTSNKHKRKEKVPIAGNDKKHEIYANMDLNIEYFSNGNFKTEHKINKLSISRDKENRLGENTQKVENSKLIKNIYSKSPLLINTNIQNIIEAEKENYAQMIHMDNIKSSSINDQNLRSDSKAIDLISQNLDIKKQSIRKNLSEEKIFDCYNDNDIKHEKNQSRNKNNEQSKNISNINQNKNLLFKSNLTKNNMIFSLDDEKLKVKRNASLNKKELFLNESTCKTLSEKVEVKNKNILGFMNKYNNKKIKNNIGINSYNQKERNDSTPDNKPKLPKGSKNSGKDYQSTGKKYPLNTLQPKLPIHNSNDLSFDHESSRFIFTLEETENIKGNKTSSSNNNITWKIIDFDYEVHKSILNKILSLNKEKNEKDLLKEYPSENQQPKKDNMFNENLNIDYNMNLTQKNAFIQEEQNNDFFNINNKIENTIQDNVVRSSENNINIFKDQLLLNSKPNLIYYKENFHAKIYKDFVNNNIGNKTMKNFNFNRYSLLNNFNLNKDAQHFSKEKSVPDYLNNSDKKKAKFNLNNNAKFLHNNTYQKFQRMNFQIEDGDEEINNNIDPDNLKDIIKKVVENNKKEAASKTRDFLKNLPLNYMNLGKTQQRYFISTSQGFRSEKQQSSQKNINTNNYFNIQKDKILSHESTLFDRNMWKRHEDFWFDLVNLDRETFLSKKIANIENVILPPNDEDVLLSYFCRINEIKDKLVINENLENPANEINKWKNAYKKVVLRWHPDKLNPILDSININEDLKIILNKRAASIINNMNRNLKNLVGVIRNIINTKEAANYKK